jgi:hypothetical protein
MNGKGISTIVKSKVNYRFEEGSIKGKVLAAFTSDNYYQFQKDCMKDDTNKKRLISILIFFGIFVALGLILISIYGMSLRSVATSMLWMLACIMTGGVIGFLFGIPKILQPSTKTDNDTTNVKENQPGNGDYKLLVNTNLTEISDWLTKIIVGLGLVNLTKLPPYINSIALSLSNGIEAEDKGSSLAFAHGVIICYTVLGFLFGYLFTRLVLSQAFADADRASIEQVKDVLSSQSIQLANLESKQGLITQSIYPEAGGNERLKAVQQDAPTLENQLSILNDMAADYMKISVADWAERTRLKDAAANTMADYALKENIPKTAILQKYEQDKNEGLALALASLINIKPEIGDIENVLKAGDGITRLHVRYRILLAIVTLYKMGFINEKDKVKTVALVNSYKKNADQSLLRMIDSTLSTLKT